MPRVSPAAGATVGAAIAAKSARAAAVVKRRIRMMISPADDSDICGIIERAGRLFPQS
jgi:hypothetical protein